jgi:hypothetical protein
MSNQVVVPFRVSRTKRQPARSSRSRSEAPPRSERRWGLRLATARDVVRALVDTISYLGDARVRPPVPPALPPKREIA